MCGDIRYVEMSYCNTLPSVEEFTWTNILLRKRIVCKKVPTSCCVVAEEYVGGPSGLLLRKIWHLQVNRVIFCWLQVELQIIYPITAQRNFSLLAEVKPHRCFLDFQKAKQSHRLQALVDARKRTWEHDSFLTEIGNPSFNREEHNCLVETKYFIYSVCWQILSGIFRKTDPVQNTCW